jgi:folate-binding protein YgfZ
MTRIDEECIPLAAHMFYQGKSMFDELFDEFGSVSSQGFIPSHPSENRPAATLLSQFSLIKVTGPDSERFLQGQLTCDTSALTGNNWLAGACCTAKGRMVANFILVKTPDGFLLRLPRVQADVLMTHLKKYIVFFKSTLSLAADLHLVGIINPEDTAAPDASFHVLEDGYQLTWADGRQEFWGTKTCSEKRLNGDLCAESAWQIADITHGWMWVQNESTEAWVPQYIGWQHQHGISFSKGCYTGQEIIARLQYLGKSKKNLYRISTETDLPAVMSEIQNNGKTIGELASRCGKHGLAVVNSHDESFNAEISGQAVVLDKVFYTEE